MTSFIRRFDLLSSLLFIVLFSSWSATLYAQFGVPENTARLKLEETTRARYLATLLQAVGHYDDGNFDLVSRRGMLPGGSEHHIFRQVIHDERVRKIYGLLKDLPEEHATQIVSTSFRDSLSKLQSDVAKSGFGHRTTTYGLHVKLWLAFEFESREEFNSHFAEWNNWYVDQLASRSYLDKNPGDSDLNKKVLFSDSAAPELVMYLNLVLIDQSRREGLETFDSTEFSQVLGSDAPNYASVEFLPFDSDSREPLTVIPFFVNWGGLDSLDVNERADLVWSAQMFLEKERKLGNRVGNLVSSVFFLEQIGGVIRGLEKEKAQKEKTRIEFLGAEDAAWETLSRSWSPARTPTKKEVMQAVNFLLKKTSPEERAQWKRIIAEFESWLTDFPMDGSGANDQKVWVWSSSDWEQPEASETDKQPEADLEGQSRLRFRFSLGKDIRALTDESVRLEAKNQRQQLLIKAMKQQESENPKAESTEDNSDN